MKHEQGRRPASRTAWRRGAVFASMALAVALTAAAPLQAQMANRLDPLNSAMPVAERPAELKDARDTVTVGSQALRLNVDVWVKVAPCPGKKPRDNCFKSSVSGGRMFLALWGEKAISGFEIEKVWMLHKGQVWNTTELKKTADGRFEFEGGPGWTHHEPVDVVVKLRGVDELLQSRFRTLYPLSS